MDDRTNDIVLRVIERMPQWIRHDLQAKDAVARARAEEVLATMITTALAEGTA